MMNYLWAGMLLLALVSAVMQGNMGALSAAVLNGANDAVSLCIKLLAALCLWGGVLRIAQDSGLTTHLSRLFSPLLRLLFPRLAGDSPALQAISMNITANMLGLGNAATPLGLEAMRHLDDLNGHGKTASREMIFFVVLNSAAFHLLPTTVAALRQNFGSANPMDIMPAAWISSLAALTAALGAVKLFSWILPR